MSKIFDTHTHYTASQFDENRHEIFAALPAQNVCGVVDCGTDYATTVASLALGEEYPWFYTAAGIHPESIIDERASTQTVYGGDWKRELLDLAPLYENERAVAVGESGLDYHWPVPKDAQLALFEAELQCAREHDLPILIHDREAHEDTYRLLKQYRPKGIVHCYSGSADDAAWIVKQGLYIGVGGVLTYKNARKLVEVVASVPLEALLLETDCPYLAPVPLRGQLCHSGMLCHVAAQIAAIKQISVDEVLRVTQQNANTLFALPRIQKG